MVSALTDTLAWVVIAAFGTSAILQTNHRQYSRYAAVAAWTLFAAFWGLLVPYYFFEHLSLIEGVLSAVAVPACLYTAYLVGTGKRQLVTLTRSIAIMGLLFLPFQTIEPARQFAIEAVAQQAEWLMAQFGYYPPVVEGDHGYLAKFVFTGESVTGESGHRYTTTVLMACTGIGSMSIVGGLALAVKAPMKRRMQALAVALPVIYGLNVIRVVFIAVAHGKQWFRGGIYESLVFVLFPTNDGNMVSYLFADRVLAQSASVVALVVLTFALLRIVPELGGVVEDVAYIATGNEYEITRRFAE
ncbi:MULTISPECIES: archaeosortase A [unclassified Halobacterium]|uniref:archaeosortase A n=1 Tax=unclassified Halobacterium TaxID=2668073 RepID=UPI001E4335F5|nr:MULTISPECIES: archaeosortase A [unclassified Halobacterium]MCD2198667.1 archaeosortase A [Halobacterium sp. KA-4]MCD2201857.1 archaeosortase A [Halobacterium sp. KA-6]